ncbi:FTR1 family protein [Pseudomonas sp. MMS21-TM103]|uniref:FTR1 family iron permease n=1 Tax=Pseudomonas sp. MMS21 TM103 TaxID=2886506 RepID=UPI001EDCBA0F|nr:FTR1 family protein [Pseudomonas sp. MMS21 TM103]MCG4455935.1 FTR1 family protein [Pseudomonas sp. MMS21 TM103]
MEQSLFIVWRESIEALLVIGILQAWISQQAERGRAMTCLWGGVALGLLLSAALALAILFAGEWLAGAAGEWFQAGLVLLASGLILQMVGWMRRHGRTLKSDLQQAADSHLQRNGGLGLLLLAMLAVGREGSETVVFLYGLGVHKHGAALWQFALGGAAGLGLALLTFMLLQAGSRLVSWRHFFRCSESVLLLLGASMLIAGLDRISGQLMALELPEQVYGWFGAALWDTSAGLDDASGLGSVLANFAGYRAMPSLATVAVLAGYWLLVAFWLRRTAPAVSPCAN